jgi:Mg2+-importing ATPase
LVATTAVSPAGAAPLSVSAYAAQPAGEVLAALGTSSAGLPAAEAAARLAAYGPNAVRSHRTRALPVLLRQLRSPLLLLLLVTATASFFVGQRTDALIIGLIVTASVGLGFGNEYRAEQAAEALHSQLRHRALVRRDGRATSIDVTELVPGDLVDLQLGEVVPADLRLVTVAQLVCDESVLTGESTTVEKSVDPVPPGSGVGDLTSCALMGTVVRGGAGTGVVVATGGGAEFGRIALALGERHPDTEFQIGLRRFSLLLVRVAAALTAGIFLANLVLHRPLLDALLFSLAIAVGISPQLLPAVVSTSLATGSRRLARRKVLVKRLVCIEDLGNIALLFTDKTGTLTDGRVRFMRAVGPDGAPADRPLLLGLLCNEAEVQDGRPVGGNPLDVALWESPASARVAPAVQAYTVVERMPFDHESRTAAVRVTAPDGSALTVVKGAPESLLPRCAKVPAAAAEGLAAEFAAGSRVIAVATGVGDPDGAEGLALEGFLVFLDPPKPDAAESLERLAGLGIEVKIVTGDNAAVAAHVCDQLGLPTGPPLTGGDLDDLTDEQFGAVIRRTTIFARVSPEQKARIVRVQRQAGGGVAFLGDGVNDALALHAADVGISVDSGTDVAKDAADILLLEKDLDVLADGVVEGRRIFANTLKYVLMGTSSNFGNMFSAAVASATLSFLPMLPSQILLNNLLYDASQLTIPTDHVDAEQLARPSHWDVPFLRRFMLVFGPLSSLFDFATFAIMLWGFSATAPLFRTGWFVESLATQTLIIFAIRTRRVPFFRSTPSVPLIVAGLGVVLVGLALPATPLAHDLGFRPLPVAFLFALIGLAAAYLVLIELAKTRFYRMAAPPVPAPPVAAARRRRRVHRRAARFSTTGGSGGRGQ